MPGGANKQNRDPLRHQAPPPHTKHSKNERLDLNFKTTTKKLDFPDTGKKKANFADMTGEEQGRSLAGGEHGMSFFMFSMNQELARRNRELERGIVLARDRERDEERARARERDELAAAVRSAERDRMALERERAASERALDRERARERDRSEAAERARDAVAADREALMMQLLTRAFKR